MIWKPWYHWLCWITFGHNWYNVNVVYTSTPAIEQCGVCRAARWSKQKHMFRTQDWPYYI